MIFPSTVNFRAIVSAGDVLGSDVTLEDVKAAEVIWGHFILKMKGNMVRRNNKRVVQSIIKVPTEFIKFYQDVKIAIDIFLSTNTSSSWPIAQRSASPRSLIWHTARKNISGKLSWGHTTCTHVKASISL
jgi:hypothetical protein